MLERTPLTEIARKESASSASNYSQYSAQQQKASEDLSKNVLAHFGDRKNLRFYDVGCGTGGLLNQLRSKGYNGSFWGADYSKERIHLARKQAKADNFQAKIHFQTNDAQHACQLRNTYDVLFATSMLHHIAETDHPGVFNQFFQTLRAGGCLGIVTYGPDMPLDKAIKDFIIAQGNSYGLAGYQSPRVYLSAEKYAKNLAEAGYILVSQEDKTHIVSSEEDLLNPWLKGWLPSYQYLCFEKNDAHMAEQYLKDLCTHLQRQFPDGIPITHMEIIARKPANQLDHAVAFGTRSEKRKQAQEEKSEDTFVRNLRPRQQ